MNKNKNLKEFNKKLMEIIKEQLLWLENIYLGEPDGLIMRRTLKT